MEKQQEQTTLESIHIYEKSQLQSQHFTPEALTAAYVNGLAALNEKLERENPQPLSLEDLREMDGEPVWCVCMDNPSDGIWSLVQVHDDYDEDGNCLLEEDEEPGEFWCHNPVYGGSEALNSSTYGKEWLAYKHKPKEESHA